MWRKGGQSPGTLDRCEPLIEKTALPWDKAERSAALHSYEVLDTPTEEDFDDLARVASRICGRSTPGATIMQIFGRSIAMRCMSAAICGSKRRPKRQAAHHVHEFAND